MRPTPAFPWLRLDYALTRHNHFGPCYIQPLFVILLLMSYRKLLLTAAVLSLLCAVMLFFIPFTQVTHVPESRGQCPQTGLIHCDAIWIIPARDETVVGRSPLWWSPLLITAACAIAVAYPRLGKSAKEIRRGR